MTNVLLFAIVGVGLGAAYAGLGMGIVVIHRATGVINVAHGALVMWAAYIYDELTDTGRLVLPVGTVPLADSLGPWPSMAIATAATCLLAVGVHSLVFRPLRSAPPLAAVVASVGVLIASQALVVLRFGSEQRRLPALLPTERIQLGELSFARDRIYLVVIAGAMAALISVLYRRSRIGLAARASCENELAASLAGFSPNVIALVAWTTGAAASSVLVLFITPSIGLNPVNVTLFVVPALAAALAGRLTSVGLTCAAGLALGVVQSELAYVSTRSWWPDWASVGTAEALPFVAIVVLLFTVGKGLPSRGEASADQLPAVRRRPIAARTIGATVLFGALALTLTGGSYRFGVINTMIAAVIALSLVVLTGLVGQPSLAQGAIAGSAGFILSRLSVGAGVSFPLSAIGAILASGLIGLVVGLPALRIRGAQLAVVSLAAAVTIERAVFRNPALSPPNGNLIPNAEIFSIDLAVRRGTDLARIEFGLFVLAVLAVLAVLVGNLMRSATGRALLAIRSNERAAAAAGLSVVELKVVAFFVSSCLAGTGGVLIGYSRGQLSVESFTVLVGLSYLAFAYLGGITSVSGAVIAGVFAPLGVGYVIAERTIHLGRYYTLAAGIALIVTAIRNPSGISGRIYSELDRRRTLRRERQSAGEEHERSGNVSPPVEAIRVS